MRLTALALVVLFAAACGGDEPEQTETPPPTMPQRPPADTTMADTVAAGDTTGQAGQPGQQGRPGQPGQQGQQGQGTAAGEAGGETGATAGQRLYTVQVAAFTESSSAREWEGRLQSQGLPVWTSMAELGGRTFYRLRVGAVPTVSEARSLGAMLSERYEWPVWVAPVGPADRMPANAVQTTRGILEGS